MEKNLNLSNANVKTSLKTLYDMGILDKVVTDRELRYFDVRYKLAEDHYLLPELQALVVKNLSFNYGLSGYFPTAKLVVMAGRFIGGKSKYDLVIVDNNPKTARKDLDIAKKLVHFSPKTLAINPTSFIYRYLAMEDGLQSTIENGYIIKNDYDFLKFIPHRRHLKNGTFNMDRETLIKTFNARERINSKIMRGVSRGEKLKEILDKIENPDKG